MQFISSVWRIGLPVVVVAGSALALVGATRSRGRPAPLSRGAIVAAVFVWLTLAGDAALGDRRPVFEREWKGAAAVLLAATAAADLWRRRRWRAPAASPAAAVQSAARSSAHHVTMPALGEDVIEGTVTRWLKEI